MEKLLLGQAKLQTIIWTSRMAEAERFYTEILGLALRGESGGALRYDVNGGDLRVSPVPSTQPTAHTVMGFAVVNLDTTIAELAKRGVNWVRFPGFSHDERAILKTPVGARVVWFRDPDGNLLSIVQFAA